MITLISKLEGVDKNKHLPVKTCHVWGKLKMKIHVVQQNGAVLKLATSMTNLLE